MSTTDITKLRRSAAHLLAMAVLELHNDAKLGTFGITDSGFYYDIEFDEPISSDVLPAIQVKMLELVQANVKISSVQKTQNEAIAYFTEKEQPYKRETLDDSGTKKVDLIVIGENSFQDIKVGDVVESAKSLENCVLLDVSGAYWKGDDKRSMLTRISGACFATAEELSTYQEYRIDVLRRDHRVMGKKLGYFSVDPEIGTGLVFWSPRGRYVRDVIAGLIKSRMFQLGAEMVETPMLGNSNEIRLITQPQNEQIIAKSLSEEGEHWYAIRQQVIGSHLRMFSWKERSYRDLPWRVGEIAKVIRYEKMSELEGLHRTREITQDTITIACTHEQIEKEVEILVQIIVQFARDLGFPDFELHLRLPDAISKADNGEATFLSGLFKTISRRQSVTIIEDAAGRQVSEVELVLIVKDSLRQHREWSKIQLLFKFPLEQQLTYMGKDGELHAPVVIRATIAGSLERVIATLIEHYAGVLPLWLTYEHARVIPVTSQQELYAEKIVKQLTERGIHATTDLTSEPLEGKIKQAEEEKVPYMLVVGEKEQATDGVSVRVQGHGDIGLLDMETFIKDIQGEVQSKSIKSSFV